MCLHLDQDIKQNKHKVNLNSSEFPVFVRVYRFIKVRPAYTLRYAAEKIYLPQYCKREQMCHNWSAAHFRCDLNYMRCHNNRNQQLSKIQEEIC